MSKASDEALQAAPLADGWRRKKSRSPKASTASPPACRRRLNNATETDTLIHASGTLNTQPFANTQPSTDKPPLEHQRSQDKAGEEVKQTVEGKEPGELEVTKPDEAGTVSGTPTASSSATQGDEMDWEAQEALPALASESQHSPRRADTSIDLPQCENTFFIQGDEVRCEEKTNGSWADRGSNARPSLAAAPCRLRG